MTVLEHNSPKFNFNLKKYNIKMKLYLIKKFLSRYVIKNKKNEKNSILDVFVNSRGIIVNSDNCLSALHPSFSSSNIYGGGGGGGGGVVVGGATARARARARAREVAATHLQFNACVHLICVPKQTLVEKRFSFFSQQAGRQADPSLSIRSRCPELARSSFRSGCGLERKEKRQTDEEERSERRTVIS